MLDKAAHSIAADILRKFPERSLAAEAAHNQRPTAASAARLPSQMPITGTQAQRPFQPNSRGSHHGAAAAHASSIASRSCLDLDCTTAEQAAAPQSQLVMHSRGQKPGQ